MKNKICIYCGLECEFINYKGVQILKNPFTGAWFLMFKNDTAPFYGKLKAVKKVIDQDGATDFISENTYKEIK